MRDSRRYRSFSTSRKTAAWFWIGSRASYRRVSLWWRRSPSSRRSASFRCASSTLYRCSNAFQRADWCPNHTRSSVLGAMSLSQRSRGSCAFGKPRGHSRSTSTRAPSTASGASRARLMTTRVRVSGPSRGGACADTRMPSTMTPLHRGLGPKAHSVAPIFHIGMQEVKRHLLPFKSKEIASISRSRL